MPVELYKKGDHLVVSFNDLVKGEGIQSNQLLIKHGHHSALLDPGGDLTFMPLNIAIGKYEPLKELDYVLASHQDPDIVSALDKWLMHTNAKVVVSKLWVRFIHHLIPSFMADKTKDRILAIPDEGMDLPLGRSVIKLIPAHFLHSPGNFHFYDPVSKILFSGDVGASMVTDAPDRPVRDFARHVKKMQGFHQRYMTSNKACRLWVKMVRQLDVEMIVPQHGRPFKGEIIGKFLDWFEKLECGVDRINEQTYQIP